MLLSRIWCRSGQARTRKNGATTSDLSRFELFDLCDIRRLGASILGGGLAALLFEKTGTWDYAFYISAGLALCSAIAAVGLLRMPMPKKQPQAVEEPVAAGVGTLRASGTR